MVFHSTNTRLLFVGFTFFVAISVYVLVVTHHLKLPTYDLSIGGTSGAARDRASLEEVHHLALEDFVKYDKDRDSKLSVHEFAAMLRAARTERGKQPADGRMGAGSGADGKGRGGEVKIQAEALEIPTYYEDDAYDLSYHEPEERHKDSDDEYYMHDDEDYKGQEEEAGDGEEADEEKKAETAFEGALSAAAAKVNDGSIDTAAAASSGCGELTRELVAAFARDNTVMLTVADWKIFGTMGINWMKHLAKLKVDYYLVGATDQKTAAFLGGLGKHPCFRFYKEGAGQNTDDKYRYGDLHYVAATWRKVAVVSRLVHWGFNVLHSDVDVVWFRDPLPYFLGPAVENVDIAISTDLISTNNPAGDEGLEVHIHQHVNFNTGVYFVRATEGGKAWMTAWCSVRVMGSNENDQVGAYRLLRERHVEFKGGRYMELVQKQGEAEAAAVLQGAGGHEVLEAQMMSWEQQRPKPITTQLPLGSRVKVGLLGVHMLLNGYSYFIPKLHQALKVQPLGVHMTWVPLSREGKFHRFRDGMLYDDEPEYYDSPGLRFLTADIDAPDAPEGFNTWRETEDMIQVHLANMKPQLQQMYRVMAVAAALNRTLVFPRMKCYCFKNWFMSEQCRIPGDKVTQFPMDCALDQVFRPKVLYNYPPLQTKDGPQAFTFREYSMLDNPRTPASVRADQALVVPKGFPEGDTAGFTRVVHVPANMTQEQLVDALQGVRSSKVVRLRHAVHIFGGFTDPVLEASFATFAHNITANWCCRDEPYVAKGMAKKVKLAMEW